MLSLRSVSDFDHGSSSIRAFPVKTPARSRAINPPSTVLKENATRTTIRALHTVKPQRNAFPSTPAAKAVNIGGELYPSRSGCDRISHTVRSLSRQPLEYTSGRHTYSCSSSHFGNSSIEFYDQFTQTKHTGVIVKILQLPLEHILQTFFFVQEHLDLPHAEQQKTPYINHPRFLSKVVHAGGSNQFYLVEPKNVITHLTTLTCPIGTFDIPFETWIICWGLNWGRK